MEENGLVVEKSVENPDEHEKFLRIAIRVSGTLVSPLMSVSVI